MKPSTRKPPAEQRARSHSRLAGVLILLAVAVVGCGGKEEAGDGARPALSPKALMERAAERERVGAYAEAIEDLQKALQAEPENTDAHEQVARVYDAWDKREEAIAAYQKVLGLKPGRESARMGLAAVYSRQTRNLLAASEYLKVAKTRPGDAELHFKIALEYWYAQKLPETARHYQKVIELVPDYVQAHLNLASVYERQKKWDLAMRELDLAIKLGREKNDEQAIAIAERKLKFIQGRESMTAEELDRKTQPPFN